MAMLPVCTITLFGKEGAWQHGPPAAGRAHVGALFAHHASILPTAALLRALPTAAATALSESKRGLYSRMLTEHSSAPRSHPPLPSEKSQTHHNSASGVQRCPPCWPVRCPCRRRCRLLSPSCNQPSLCPSTWPAPTVPLSLEYESSTRPDSCWLQTKLARRVKPPMRRQQ